MSQSAMPWAHREPGRSRVSHARVPLVNQSVESPRGVPSGFVVRAVAFLAMGPPWEAVSDLDRALRLVIRGAAPRGLYTPCLLP